jgi:hypothetical protein
MRRQLSRGVLMDNNRKKLADLHELRELLTRWIPGYDSDARRVDTTTVRPIWVREFWRQLGGHPRIVGCLYPPDEDRSEQIQLLKQEAQRVPRDLLPRRARLLYWDSFTYFFTDESDPDPDPCVLGFNGEMEEPTKVTSSFLLYVTGVVLRAALPVDPGRVVEKAPAGATPLFPSLHPRVVTAGGAIYVPLDDDEEAADPRLLVVPVPDRAS